MVGEEGAIEGGAEGAEDTGIDDSGDAGASAEAEGVGAPDAGAKSTTAPKFKLRRFGREHELAAEEMAKMLDDDFEHVFHGVGGKPLLVDGKPLSARNKDILRYVQMGKGAADSARRYNEAAKQFQNQIEWGKHPDNRLAFMRDVMGVEDPRQWALEYAAKAFARRSELAKLAQTDPLAHQRELEKDFREEQAAIQKARENRDGKTRQESERVESEKRFYGTVSESLKAVGVPMNSRTRELVDETCREWSEADADLSFEQLAEIVRDAYHEDIFGYLDGKQDEDLLKLFGDKRRARLRNAEIEAHKRAKKTAGAADPPKPRPTTSNGNSGRGKKEGMTAEEFMRSSRNGGRI